MNQMLMQWKTSSDDLRQSQEAVCIVNGLRNDYSLSLGNHVEINNIERPFTSMLCDVKKLHSSSIVNYLTRTIKLNKPAVVKKIQVFTNGNCDNNSGLSR